MSAVSRWFRGHPLTLVITALLVLGSLLSVLPVTRLALAPELTGLEPTLFADRRWAALGASMFVAGSAAQLVVVILASVTGLGWAERLLGWRRALLAFLATGLVATTTGVGVVYLGTLFREFWASSVAEVETVDPLIPIAGAVAWATAVAPPPWSRRVRVLLLAAASAFLLYSGQPGDLYRLLAVALGILGGRLTQGPRPRARASARERRGLLALITVVFALGPLLTLLITTRYGLLSPLGLAISDVIPVQAAPASTCVAGHVAPGCIGELTRARFRGVGPVLVSLLPLGIMLIAARGLLAGRRMAVWVVAVVAAGESGLAAFFYGIVPLSGSPWFAALAPRRYWELSLWILVSTLVPLALAVVLILNRRVFPVLPSLARVLGWAGTLVGGLVVSAGIFVVGALAVPGSFRPRATPGLVVAVLPERFIPETFLRNEYPALVPGGALGRLLYDGVGPLFWLTAAVATLLALRGGSRLVVEAPEADRIRALLRRGSGSLGFMATWAGNRLWTTPDGSAGIAFRVVNGHAVTLSDPFGDTAEPGRLADGFVDFCDRMAWVPVFYSVHDEWRELLETRGWRSVPVAEETVLDPAAFSTSGKRMQDVRNAVNRAARTGITVRFASWRSLPLRITAQIGTLSERWMAEKDLPELGFTLGGVTELQDDGVLVGVALDEQQRVLAVASWLPVWSGGVLTGWTLDFMRRSSSSPNGVMEYLLAQSIERFRDQGVGSVSLSGSPLVQPEGEGPSPLLATMLSLVGRALEPLYGFRALLRFKRKFGVRERSLHLCYADPLGLPAIGLAIAGCYLPGFGVHRLPALLGSSRREPAAPEPRAVPT